MTAGRRPDPIVVALNVSLARAVERHRQGLPLLLPGTVVGPTGAEIRAGVRQVLDEILAEFLAARPNALEPAEAPA